MEKKLRISDDNVIPCKIHNLPLSFFHVKKYTHTHTYIKTKHFGGTTRRIKTSGIANAPVFIQAQGVHVKYFLNHKSARVPVPAAHCVCVCPCAPCPPQIHADLPKSQSFSSWSPTSTASAFLSLIIFNHSLSPSLLTPWFQEKDLIHSLTLRYKGLRRSVASSGIFTFYLEAKLWARRIKIQKWEETSPTLTHTLCFPMPQRQMRLLIRFCLHFSKVSFSGQFRLYTPLSKAQTILLPIRPLGQKPHTKLSCSLGTEMSPRHLLNLSRPIWKQKSEAKLESFGGAVGHGELLKNRPSLGLKAIYY